MTNANQEVKATEKLFVDSIFFGIQSEGNYAGYPCTFVRLAEDNNGDEYSVKEIVDEASSIAEEHECYSIVITGGEPTLQSLVKKFIFDWLLVLTEESNFLDTFVQIETDGSNPAFFEDGDWKRIAGSTHVVCIPKADENTKQYVKLSSSVIENVDEFRFCVSADPESPYHKVLKNEEIQSLYSEHGEESLIPKKYYLTPIVAYKESNDSIDQEKTCANFVYAADSVVSNSRYCLSLPLRAFMRILFEGAF